MAPVIPILAGVGGGATAAFLGASTAVSTGVGVATGVATASMMNRASGSASVAPPPVPEVPTAETDTTVVDTSSPTGGPDTTINDVVSVQEDVRTQADTTQQAPITDTAAQVGTAAGGQAEATAAMQTSVGQAEDEAISFYEKGRRSTILTRATGLLSEQAQEGTFRRRRTLVGSGLIA
jgi:hypothetical protein